MNIIGQIVKHSIILTVLAGGINCYTQEIPEKPLIKFVHVDSDSQTIEIQWEASATPDIDEYEVYSLNISDSGGPSTKALLTTVGGSTLHCTLAMTESFPQTYTIVAVKDEKYSLVGGDYHRPVKLQASYDSCNAAMELSWSKYLGWKDSFSGYKIFEIDADGNASQLQIQDSSQHSFTRHNIQENKQYKYFVEAFNNAGYKSSSNKVEYFTYMSPAPDFVYLDQVTVLDEGSVEIAFSTELNDEIDDFMISRAKSVEGAYIPLKTIYDLNTPTVVEYDYFPTMAENYYYRIDAINGCGRSVASSNTGGNLLLRGEADEVSIHLRWNAYESFGSGCNSYNVYRMNEYGEYEHISELSPSSSTFTEPVTNIEAGKMNGVVNYYLEAIEVDENPLGIKGISKSNEVSVNIETHLFMPNAFTPNGDGQNDVFLPIYDFFPEEFKLFIYDRSGKMIFYSTDPANGWDGAIGSGEFAKGGVYIYHVEYQSYNGRRQVKTGNLTLIYP